MNESNLLLKEEAHRIVGCAMEVSNVLGHGKITGLRVGLLLNFKHAKLEWKRIVL